MCEDIDDDCSERKLRLLQGPRTTFDWLYPLASADNYPMGLGEHREDMNSLWKFVDGFMKGGTRFFFSKIELLHSPRAGVDLIATRVGDALRVYTCRISDEIMSDAMESFDVQEIPLPGAHCRFRGWRLRFTEAGLRFADDEGDENKYPTLWHEVDEFDREEFHIILANYVFSSWDMPFTFGSLVRIGVGESDFLFSEYSYLDYNGQRAKGIHCIDPNDDRCSYCFEPMGDGKVNPEDFSCELVSDWPPHGSRIIKEEHGIERTEVLKCFAGIAAENQIKEDVVMGVSRDVALVCLRRAVGRDDVDFRDGQWEAIDGVLHGRRQIVVQRTGWGKSMIYFLAAKFLREQGRGMTLLISPLLALMRNQVAAAERVGVRCFTINSTNVSEWDSIKAKILSDQSDLLIVSPERLANDNFRSTILEPITDRIGLLVIDEAHCVSDWGHDFRPDYKKISRLLEHLPRTVPVLATTATATSRVIDDIQAQLGGAAEVSRGSLVRKSLYLQNIRLPSQEARLAWLAETLKNRIPGSGIIYTLTIRDAEMVARWLRRNGLSAYAYSSGVRPPEDFDLTLRSELEAKPEWSSVTDSDKTSVYRAFLEDLLMANRVKALVATSALSMGFDKSDLAFVIHYQRPKSVVDYYQQVGRAGRGIDSAYGILLNGEEDDAIADYFIRSAFPKEDVVRKVLKAIAEAPEGLTKSELTRLFNVRSAKIEQVLKFVMSDVPQPVVKDRSKYRATPFVGGYRIPVETISRLTEMRHAECRQMDEYVQTKGCLMQFLCSALESPPDEPYCDRCAACRPRLQLPTEVDARVVQRAADTLRKSSVPIEPRKQWGDAARAAVRFGLDGKATIPETLRMEAGRSLSLYNAGEWGRLVRVGKYESHPPHFDGRLVEACVKMLAEWAPVKRPQWVVHVPSRRNNALVGDFAAQLAIRLGLPCWRGLVKTVDTPPQKNMENSVFQQNNIIDAFGIEGELPPGGCLLVDDMVDSGWTFTIVSAVLRQAGAEFVIPLALADSSNDGE